jgi:hypothetical protein
MWLFVSSHIVRPSVTTRTLLNWFPWNVVIWVVYQNCWQSKCCKEQQKLSRYSDWAIANSCLWFLAWTIDLSCLRNVQTASNAHPATCSEGTGHSFPWGPNSRNVKLTTPPCSAEVKNDCSCRPSPAPRISSCRDQAQLCPFSTHRLCHVMWTVRSPLCRRSPHVYVGLCPPGDNWAVQIPIVIFTNSFQFPAAHQHRHPVCSFSLNMYRGCTKLAGEKYFLLFLDWRLSRQRNIISWYALCPSVWSEYTALVFGSEMVLSNTNMNNVRA